MPLPIFFNQHLISMNLYQHEKNQTSVSICFRYVVYLSDEILQSDWPRAFWPISQEPDFCQIWDFCKNTANKINFHYRPKSEIITKFSSKFKEPCVWFILAHFPHFWGKNISKKSSSHVQYHIGPEHPADWANPKKTSYQKKGQTWIHRTLQATTGGPIRELVKWEALL